MASDILCPSQARHCSWLLFPSERMIFGSVLLLLLLFVLDTNPFFALEAWWRTLILSYHPVVLLCLLPVNYDHAPRPIRMTQSLIKMIEIFCRLSIILRQSRLLPTPCGSSRFLLLYSAQCEDIESYFGDVGSVSEIDLGSVIRVDCPGNDEGGPLEEILIAEGTSLTIKSNEDYVR